MSSAHFITALLGALALLNTVAAGQRGLAYIPKTAHSGDDSVWDAPGSPISWYYNWASTNNPAYNGKLEFVPMMWGQESASTFPQQVQSLKSAGVDVKNVLAFNEPDGSSGGGSGISASEAASLYKQYYQPLAKLGISLGGPATTGSPQGLSWYSQFMSACSGCQVDFIPIHWYGNLDGLKWYVGAVQQAYPNTKLWVTEFADSAASSSNDAASFTTAALEMFDSNPMIERYSIFPAVREGDSSIPYAGLLDNTGKLSNIGSIYMNGASTNTSGASSPVSSSAAMSSSGSGSVSASKSSSSPAAVAVAFSNSSSHAGSLPSSSSAAAVAFATPSSQPEAVPSSSVPAPAVASAPTVMVADARGPATVTVTVNSCESSSPAVVAADVQPTSTSASSPSEGSSTPKYHGHSDHGSCGGPPGPHDHSSASATPSTNPGRLARRHIVGARMGKHHRH